MPALDAKDSKAAQAFSTSWNNLPEGSVYTREQILDGFAPLLPHDFIGKSVLELGCGNASLLFHVAQLGPKEILGVDLGDSVLSAKKNMALLAEQNWKIIQDDLITFDSQGYDIVYSIGVLHHLMEPEKGFQSVVRNTKPGGHFHCWVYAHEGNAIIRCLVEPLRRFCSRLPWQLTKYGVATPLAIPFFIYAKFIALLPENMTRTLPLQSYCRWIAKREFSFFRHVAFDQLVTPQTMYIYRDEVAAWLEGMPNIKDTYIIMRNGNSWKFGGKRTQ